MERQQKEIIFSRDIVNREMFRDFSTYPFTVRDLVADGPDPENSGPQGKPDGYMRRLLMTRTATTPAELPETRSNRRLLLNRLVRRRAS